MKKGNQSEVCKVLQNVTKDLQGKSHGGIGLGSVVLGSMQLVHYPQFLCYDF